MSKLIGIHAIAELFGLGRSAAYELTHRPGFPAPVVISARCYRWPLAEVTAFAELLRRTPATRKRQRDDGHRAGPELTGRITGTVRRPARGRGRSHGDGRKLRQLTAW